MPALPSYIIPVLTGKLVVDGGKVYRDTTKNIMSLVQLRNMKNPIAGNLYYTTDYGGGIWRVDTLDKTTPENIGTVNIAQNGYRLKRIYDSTTVKVDWFRDSTK